MWPFKKKEKKIVKAFQSKYHIGEEIRFTFNGDSQVGSIINVYLDNESKVRYDVAVGGECPWVKRGLLENEIYPYIRLY